MNAMLNLTRLQGASLIDPTSDLYFTALDKTGGPTDILDQFQTVYTEIFIKKGRRVDTDEEECEDEDNESEEPRKKKLRAKVESDGENEDEVLERADEYQKHPLYPMLAQFQEQMQTLSKQPEPVVLIQEETTGYRNLTHPTLIHTAPLLLEDPVLKQFRQKTIHEKDLIVCDTIFCLYLRDVCRKVNDEFYKTIVKFVLLYRECMNEYGWIKRRETLNRAKVTEEMDSILQALKIKEGADLEPKPIKDPKDEGNEEGKQEDELYIP
jgi:hypothetical protein